MKAAVLYEAGEPLRIEEVELDVPGPQEVVVHTAAAGLCHSDLSIMNGSLVFGELPMVLGHESAGIVEAVGSQVTYVKPGDHVITCTSEFCGHCEFCLTGRPALCQGVGVLRPEGSPPRITQDGRPVSQFANLGSFAEKLLVHESAVVKIDDDIPFDRASLLGCGVTTGLGAVLNTAKVEPGSTVAVIGCGGVGLAAIEGAFIAGARQIIAVDRVAQRLERAKLLGATDVVDEVDGDSVQAVLDLTGGGVDYSFEVVGLKETTEQAFMMLKVGGTCTVVGVVMGKTIELDGLHLQMERKIEGCIMGSNRFRIDLPKWLDFYKQGRLRLDDFVTARISLEEINEGYEAMNRGEGARSVIIF